MDVDDVKTYRDAIQCLSDNQFRWASAIASDTGDKTVAVEWVFDLLIANAGRDVCEHKTYAIIELKAALKEAEARYGHKGTD